MEKRTRSFLIIGIGLGAAYIIMNAVAKKKTDPADIDDENPYIMLDSYTKDDVLKKHNIYKNKVKPVLDKILSFCGLVFLSPLFCVISLAIKIDDPGPVVFTQKRIGKGKHYILIHKFRSMKMSTPHDVPTHQLSDPDQYITRVGRVLRCTSMDELPQIWDIFRQKMSVIGPRPALWNQNDLVIERDKYGANDVMPGLTGLAQIRGRDELEIEEKARIDGEYVKKQGFLMDMRCFFGTIAPVLGHDGIVEGGTGEMHKKKQSRL